MHSLARPWLRACSLLLLISTVRKLPTPGGYTTLLAFPRDVPSAPLGKKTCNRFYYYMHGKMEEATAMGSANVDRSQLNSGGSLSASVTKNFVQTKYRRVGNMKHCEI